MFELRGEAEFFCYDTDENRVIDSRDDVNGDGFVGDGKDFNELQKGF